MANRIELTGNDVWIATNERTDHLDLRGTSDGLRLVCE